MDLPQAARAALQRTFGHADFRPLQARVVDALLGGGDVLAVLPTGGGKSICFQVPALVLDGVTLVVSPLISLMQDQVGNLVRRGVAAVALNSTMDAAAQSDALDRAVRGEVRLIYASPERLVRLGDELRTRGVRIALLAIDEAHCIVEWGHDFRPSYRALRGLRERLGGPRCIALTGSATPAVRAEIAGALGLRDGWREVLGSFDRPNLRLDVIPAVTRDDRLARLVSLVTLARDPAIVYAPTRGLVEGLARVLRDCGAVVTPYHAGMTSDERHAALTRFLGDEVRVVTATCAFGMGIDKPTVRLVVHWSMPPTPESYYQEAGRAGRDGAPSRCVLLHHPRDADLPRRQLDTTFPPERMVERAWREPQFRARQPAGVVSSIDRLAEELRPDRGRVDWSGVRRRRREAEKRIEAMTRYATARHCRRAMLVGWFGERLDRCAGCDWCRRGTGCRVS